MRPDVLGNLLNLATLVQSSRPAKSLGDLVERPAPSSLQTLINMMNPVNAIPSLTDVKKFKFLVVQHADSAIVSAETLSFSLASGI